MTEDQAYFEKFIADNAPELSHLFDFDKREINQQAVDNFMKYSSSGEKLLAQFVLGVWLGHNEYGFDLFDAVGTLDKRRINIILTWSANPIWP